MTESKISLHEFFGFKRHPFSDAYMLEKPFLSDKDRRIVQQGPSFVSYGKSFALTGPSGSGKSTLLQHLLAGLDANYYRPVPIHYGGLMRNGLLRAIADQLGVDANARNLPLLIKLQKHIQDMTSSNNGRFPVIAVDDAQMLERESLLDLCSLIVSPKKKTVAASLILVGDDTLTQVPLTFLPIRLPKPPINYWTLSPILTQVKYRETFMGSFRDNLQLLLFIVSYPAPCLVKKFFIIPLER